MEVGVGGAEEHGMRGMEEGTFEMESATKRNLSPSVLRIVAH